MLSDRLKIFRTALSLSQKELSDRLKITQAGYGKYELGKRSLPNEVIDMFINEFNLNPIWLFTGSGNMFLEDLPEKGIHCPNCGSKLKVIIDRE